MLSITFFISRRSTNSSHWRLCNSHFAMNSFHNSQVRNHHFSFLFCSLFFLLFGFFCSLSRLNANCVPNSHTYCLHAKQKTKCTKRIKRGRARWTKEKSENVGLLHGKSIFLSIASFTFASQVAAKHNKVARHLAHKNRVIQRTGNDTAKISRNGLAFRRCLLTEKARSAIQTAGVVINALRCRIERNAIKRMSTNVDVRTTETQTENIETYTFFYTFGWARWGKNGWQEKKNCMQLE